MQSSAAAVHVVAASVGFASTILLWLSLLVGAVLGRSWSLSWIKHTSLKALHWTLAATGLLLGVVHALAQLAAPGTTVHWIDEIIPFVNPSRPIGVGLGTVCMEMFIAIAFSVPCSVDSGTTAGGRCTRPPTWRTRWSPATSSSPVPRSTAGSRRPP